MTTAGTHSGPNPSATAPGGGAHESALESQIDSLLGADAPSGEAAAAPSVSEQAEAAVASIERQVESLVDQFVETPTTQPAVPSNASTPVESIGELDDQLARLTDELLLTPAPETPRSSIPAAAPAPVTTVATPEPAPVSPAFAPTAAESTPVEATAPTPTPKPQPAGPSRLVQMFARPLAGKPRLVRDTVGWLGFNTVFLAGVVWCYHLWFQKPEKPTAQHAPAALVSADADEHPHGEGSDPNHKSTADRDSHAESGHEPESHATAETQTEHAADEPVTGVTPLHKKKPTYALSNAMAEKLNVAKKSDGGHGSEKKSGSGHGAPPKSGH